MKVCGYFLTQKFPHKSMNCEIVPLAIGHKPEINNYCNLTVTLRFGQNNSYSHHANSRRDQQLSQNVWKSAIRQTGAGGPLRSVAALQETYPGLRPGSEKGAVPRHIDVADS